LNFHINEYKNTQNVTTYISIGKVRQFSCMS